MAKPVRIFIRREELIGFTSMTLQRAKDQLTGTLTVEVFMGYVPQGRVLEPAEKGSEILVYVADQLVFTGFIDRRKDASGNSEKVSTSLSLGPDQYTVTLTARGKTKYAIDSSHQHPTGTLLRTSAQEAFETLLSPWEIQLDWQADEIKLDRVRLRDGGRVVDELQRIAGIASLYMHETTDGKLRVTDASSEVTGEPLKLGVNILNFSADLTEDTDRSHVQVKGQRQGVNQWGQVAVVPTINKVRNEALSNFSPVTVQLYGDASELLLGRRAQYEVNRRLTDSKKVTLDVFHVKQTDGSPWDIGELHYVEIPPAGISDILEVVELTYTVENDNTLKTQLVLSPPPVKAKAATGARKPLVDVSREVDAPAEYDGPHSWRKPTISADASANVGVSVKKPLQSVKVTNTAPPLNIKGK